jgi:hypothetical protein
MLSLPAIELGILIGIFLIAGALVVLRSDLTRYHIPVIVLALFALTSGMLVPAAAYTIQTDAEQIDYQVESQVEGCGTVDDERVSDFSELSSDAQEVFLSTLQSNGEYTTTASPDQFRISSDSTVENYILYESDCYSLVGYSGGGLGTGLFLLLLLFFGIPLTIVLAVLAVYSYRFDNFRIPATAVSGISVAVGLATFVNSSLAISIGFLILGPVWIKLDRFNPLESKDTWKE